MNPAQRLVDAVTAFQEHDAAVQHAATVLITDRHPNLAQRLLDSWAAVGGDDPDVDVRALPPEPEAGTAAVIRAGTYAGRTYDCVSGDGGGDEYAPLWVGRRFGACVAWSDLLRMAGPQGVRIVRDGGDHAH